MITILVNFFKFIYFSWSDLICKIKSGRSKEFDGYGVYMFVGLPGSGKTISAKEHFEKIGGVGCEIVNSTRGYARYLCHLDNPEKYQYSTTPRRPLVIGQKSMLSV